MNKKKKMYHYVAVILKVVLAIGLLSVGPSKMVVQAASATTLYMKDTKGGETQTVTQTTENVEKGWSWNADTATLTLEEFDGEYIESNGDINIVLKGENRITLPATPTADSVYGIMTSSGDINIEGDEVEGEDSLTISQTAFTKPEVYVTGIRAYNNVNVTDCKLVVCFSAADSSMEKDCYSRTGIVGNNGAAYFKGSASLDMDIAETSRGAYGIARALYAQTTGNIDINVYDADSDDENVGKYLIGIGAIYAMGNGAINVSVENGNVVEGAFVIGEDAGTFTFKGGINAGTSENDYLKAKNLYYIPVNKKIEIANNENAKAGFAYKQFSNSDYGYYLMTETGEKVTQGSIETVQDNPLTFVDNPILDMGEMTVDTSYATKYLQGLVFGGSGDYSFSIDENTPLPAGLTLNQTKNDYYFYARISGTPVEEVEAGTFNVIVTDSNGATAAISIAYGAISNPPKNITVDDITFTTTEDYSGTNWSYAGATKTLSLNGYDGGSIVSEEEIKVVLTGDNRVTLPANPDESSIYGIKTEAGDVNILGDGVGEEDTLSVVQTGFAKTNLYVTGIQAANDLNVTDCRLTIDFKAADASNEKSSYARVGLVGKLGTTYITGTASLDIDISETGYGVKGVSRGLHADTSGNIDIDVYDADTEDENVGEHLEGCGGLKSTGTGSVNIHVPNGNAVEGILVLGENAGIFNFEGGINAGISENDYLKTKNWYCIPANKKIKVTDNESAKAGFLYKQFGNYDYGYYLMTEDGNKVTSGSIVTEAENALTFVDSSLLDLSGIKVGTGYAGKYMQGLVFGGSGDYSFSIDENTPLPAGLTLNQVKYDNYFYARISGTPTEECQAGTFIVIVTDSEGSRADITVDYDAITVANPVTSVALNKEEITLSVGGSETLEATILPVDASVTATNWNSSDDSVAYVTSTGMVTASKPGKATITITTRQGGFTDTCAVYVKENTPVAVVSGNYITGLVANANYIIDGQEVIVADEDGRIAIEEAWRTKTISIVKSNTEDKCNSAAQQLSIPSAEAVDIATFSSAVMLEYTSIDYTGEAHEPTVSVDGLVLGDDFTVSYSNNTEAGLAVVTVAGVGDYYGSFEKNFIIEALAMTGITVTNYSGVYDRMGHTFSLSGVPQGAQISYALEENGVYNTTKPSRDNVGTTTVYFKVSAKNYKDYFGEASIEVKGLPISDKTTILSHSTYTYDGKAKMPNVTVEGLVKDTDYLVKYQNNINAGTATVVISGTGNYEGTIEKTFVITPATIEGMTITLDVESYTYDGTAKMPTVSIPGLKKDVDYRVAYSNNVNVGTATVTVTGKNNYTGTITKPFVIREAEIEPDEPKAPAKNAILTDGKTGIQYKVTTSSATSGTLQFTKPKNKKVTKVVVPDKVTINGITYKVTSIAKNAFNGCSKMTKVTIGKNVTTIGDKAFYKCTKLTKITIPSEVNKIGKQAFYGCKKLKSITIKTTKLTSKKVGSKAFTGTPKNVTVKVPKKSLKTYKKFLYKKGLNKKTKVEK